MRVLFLGGTGNISTACVALAVARGHQVGILTRGRRPAPPEVEPLLGERDDPAALARAAAGRWDAVVDFLAYTPAQLGLAVEAFAGRTGQYVFIGTAAAYDKPRARLPITEDAPLANPFWEYARLKIACEEAVGRAERDRGLPATIVRPSYTYGPTWIPSGFGGQDYTVVDRMRRGLPVVCPGDGTALWVMTHASDFAVGLLGLVGHPGAIGEAFHVTSDEVLTWDAIYETIARAAGVEARLVHVPSALVAALVPDRGASLLGDKAHSTFFDNAKVRRVVPDFRPKVTFSEGVARSIAWFDEDVTRRVTSPTANDNIERVLAAWGRAWEGLPAGGAR
ncbi:MAG TPA: NAD-dependent epimerase/dehydratase family protein [Vicinamibacteria bacterium]|nr:NAD-dependent epimerase/dehydratase family protein [Vicinamibacteria bacterium]